MGKLFWWTRSGTFRFIWRPPKNKGQESKGSYLTHSHAGFVGVTRKSKRSWNVPIYQSHKSGAKYPIEAVDEKSSIKVGTATLKFMDTPGHTPDGQCCAVYSQDDQDKPKLLFTGDVLFVGKRGPTGSHGRDCPGSVAGVGDV